VTERKGRRRRKLLDDLKETRGYWKVKEEALDRTGCRTRFGRGYGPVKTDYGMNDENISQTEGCVQQDLKKNAGSP
jgi:hypothetical protein